MYLEYYKLWRDYDLLCMIFSTMGLAIQFINYEYDMHNFDVRDPVKYIHAMDDPINA